MDLLRGRGAAYRAPGTGGPSRFGLGAIDPAQRPTLAMHPIRTSDTDQVVSRISGRQGPLTSTVMRA